SPGTSLTSPDRGGALGTGTAEPPGVQVLDEPRQRSPPWLLSIVVELSYLGRVQAERPGRPHVLRGQPVPPLGQRPLLVTGSRGHLTSPSAGTPRSTAYPPAAAWPAAGPARRSPAGEPHAGNTPRSCGWSDRCPPR